MEKLISSKRDNLWKIGLRNGQKLYPKLIFIAPGNEVIVLL